MHRALFISEIVSLVCDNLRIDTRSLACLARTCGMLTGPALDVLWESQESLAPLIQVMPPDLWTIELVNSMPHMSFRRITFRRDLVETDWTPRLEYYGRKIRHLHQLYWAAFVVHQDVFMTISSYRPMHDLVPNLRKLSLTQGHPHFSKAITFFQCVLGPKIQDLYIGVGGQAEASSFETLLSAIPRLCPNVLSFRVNSTALPASTHSMLYRCLCSQSNLRTVNVMGSSSIPTKETIIHFGRLSSLAAWHSVTIPSTPERLLFTTDGQRFANLRDFGFTAPSWDAATNVIHNMRCAFTTLRVNIDNGESGEFRLSAFEQFLGAFKEHPSITSLLEFSVTGSVVSHQDPSEIREAFSQQMRTLFLFKSLRSLEVTVPTVSLLDDSWLSEAATTWPRLRYLVLDGRGPPHMTLAGWIPLLQNCPELTGLHVSSLWRPFPTKRLSDIRGGVCNARITDIMLQDSVIESPVAVFRCLVMMFPQLRGVENEGNGEFDEGWIRLQKMLEESVEVTTRQIDE